MKIADIPRSILGTILALVLLLVPPSLNPIGKSFAMGATHLHALSQENQTVGKGLVGIQEETGRSIERISFLVVLSLALFVSSLRAIVEGSSEVLAVVISPHRRSRVLRR